MNINDIAREIYAVISQAQPLGTGIERGQLNNDMFVRQYLLITDKTLGSRIDAHGISKGTIFQQVETLCEILTNGFIPGKILHTAPLENPQNIGAAFGTASGTCYKDDLFILISDPDEELEQNGIAAVLVNPAAENLVAKLTEKFPSTRFVSYEDVNKYFLEKKLISEKQCREFESSIAGVKTGLDQSEKNYKAPLPPLAVVTVGEEDEKTAFPSPPAEINLVL